MAACVPRACTTDDAITALLFNTTVYGFEYGEEYCRLPNDKPWVTVDSVALVLFSTIGVLTGISTFYEIVSIFMLNRKTNTCLRLFSIYSNTKSLLRSPQSEGNIKCLEGIKTVAMILNVIGHSINSVSYLQNPTYYFAKTVLSLWATCFGIMLGTVYILYCVKQPTWNHVFVDAIINTIMRPLWSAAVGWLVLACAHGYGALVQVNGYLHLDWEVPNQALNQSLYEDVLDLEECQKQIVLDSGIRLPRGLLAGNTVDLGNYHQCLQINATLHNTDIGGKYCMIRVPLNQELQLQPILTSQPSHFDPFSLHLDEDTITKIKDYKLKRAGLKALFGADLNEIRSGPGNPFEFSVLRLAVCIPKPCTTEEAISGLLFNVTSLGFQYEDDFCRLPNDKPWVPADFTAFGIFSLIGLLSFLSTYYELNHIFGRNRDPKSANQIFCMFSVYSNTKRLLTFKSVPGALECLDGVRALAMLWVLLGHSFSSQLFTYNAIESFQWVLSYEGLWLTSAHITVDTFFMLSGLLVVYTSAGKLTSVGLLKNIHIFYLNRLLRMFPILATTALLEASVFNRISDGPVWDTIVSQTHRCRTFWWSTLLHVQNYLNSENVCIGATWYLAIDVQLHLLSPLILVWVLSGNKRITWSALTAGVVLSLTAATVYNFINEFPTGMITAERGDEMMYYMVYYYMNTLTRAPPFLVGMVFGYLLHTYRGKPVNISTILNLILWALSLSLLLVVCYCTHPTMQPGWDNQTVDSLINSFMRPAWALGLGWVIFACVHGYGGPINWLLTLNVWKLPARLSYAMYILHFSLMMIFTGLELKHRPIHLRGDEMMYYMVYYYMNTLTRAPPFVVGMVFGNLLHTYRGKPVYISTILNLTLWALSLSLLLVVCYCTHPTMQPGWDNQTVDSLINSFMRPAWALGLGWVIFACVHGYGGPINWFLTLNVWKLPARLSYAMYILHFSLMMIFNSSNTAPIYFTVPYIIFLFYGYFVLTFIVAIVLTVLIDMPFSILFKLLLDKIKDDIRDVLMPYVSLLNNVPTVGADNSLSLTQSGFGMCIPASCTVQEALSAFFFNLTETGISVNADFYRLPNDKPWVPADYVAIVVFSTIGLLVILSTIYDVWMRLLLKKDPKDISVLYSSFSTYTNCRRLLTFKSSPNSLHCIDGIRALAMFWVIAGHTIFSVAFCINRLEGLMVDNFYAFQWLISRKAFWITSAPITVDTFFMISGLLVVYTTVGKLNNIQLIRNLPIFYLSRLLRMFPILAAMILYLVSFHNRIADGPNWNIPAQSILTCRQYWWSALLHIQNWYNAKAMCLSETWYLSVDVQLHILSPIVLFWVLTGRKLWAWTALTLGLLTSVAAATAYNFVNNFQSGIFSQNVDEIQKYQIYYYTNTLTRASPFFVGMIFGYILHIWKGRLLRSNKVIIWITWLCALSLLGLVVYCVRLNLEKDWDNQLVDNILNSFMRPAWAIGLGWVIFACEKGHGDASNISCTNWPGRPVKYEYHDHTEDWRPINWFLCLDIWKLPARLSYAMYLIHLTLITTKYSTASLQNYFSVENLIFDITTFLIITMLIAFVATLTIDAPFTTLFKLLIFKGMFLVFLRNSRI
ncbi:Nose resistant to fluoxetine protein 6 [Papilio machaon]|uniref:Nose resistant to fluoxetine protein 6 n=1 Tax=Papilio machaon TaxID=76193 RepID=A0A194QTR0_PAPMA|nr:Nose resistant to fluoxetine protein 6 [Papilio machaon]